MRVSNPDRDELAQVETKFEIVETDQAFKFAVVTKDGADSYFLPKSVPLKKAAADVFIAEKKATVRELSQRIETLESDPDDALIRVSKQRFGRGAEAMTKGEAQQRIEDLKQEKVSTEKVSDQIKIQKEINFLEEALAKQEVERVSTIKSYRGAIQGVGQGIAETQLTDIDLNEEVVSSLNTKKALNSLNNNSWSPRTRTASQQKVDWFRLKFADKFAPIMMMQEDIEAAREGELREIRTSSEQKS